MGIPFELLIMPLLGVVVIIIGVATTGIFRKQAAAWGFTGLMVVVAVFIGLAKSPMNSPAPDPMTRPTAASPTSIPEQGQSAAPAPGLSESFVWDNAKVLSDQTVQVLDARNERLWNRCRVTVGVVTCDYGGDDLYGYALQCAEDMGLGGYDMIVVLDISGDNYWLLQGDDIRPDFTDNDCAGYAYDYMEDSFARGMYDDAVLNLTEALEVWYGNYNL